MYVCMYVCMYERLCKGTICIVRGYFTFYFIFHVHILIISNFFLLLCLYKKTQISNYRQIANQIVLSDEQVAKIKLLFSLAAAEGDPGVVPVDNPLDILSNQVFLFLLFFPLELIIYIYVYIYIYIFIYIYIYGIFKDTSYTHLHTYI